MAIAIPANSTAQWVESGTCEPTRACVHIVRVVDHADDDFVWADVAEYTHHGEWILLGLTRPLLDCSITHWQPLPAVELD